MKFKAAYVLAAALYLGSAGVSPARAEPDSQDLQNCTGLQDDEIKHVKVDDHEVLMNLGMKRINKIQNVSSGDDEGALRHARANTRIDQSTMTVVSVVKYDGSCVQVKQPQMHHLLAVEYNQRVALARRAQALQAQLGHFGPSRTGVGQNSAVSDDRSKAQPANAGQNASGSNDVEILDAIAR